MNRYRESSARYRLETSEMLEGIAIVTESTSARMILKFQTDSGDRKLFSMRPKGYFPLVGERYHVKCFARLGKIDHLLKFERVADDYSTG